MLRLKYKIWSVMSMNKVSKPTFLLLCVCATAILSAYLWKRSLKIRETTKANDNVEELHLVRSVLNANRGTEDFSQDGPTPSGSFKVEQDNSERFGIVRNVFNSEEQIQNKDVSIITHCDGTRLRNIIDLADAWRGPIEIAVFMTSHKLWKATIEVINGVRENYKYVKQYVNWHILFPRLKNYHQITSPHENSVIYTQKYISLPELARKKSSKSLMDRKLNNLHEQIVDLSLNGSTAEHIAFYPHTIAMNVAFNACRTEYLLSIDSDLIPSEALRKDFLNFAESLNLFAPARKLTPFSKIRDDNRMKSSIDSPGHGICNVHIDDDAPLPDMYVIPAFQSKNEQVPRNMASLGEAIKAGTASRFFEGMDGYSYRPTNHLVWMILTENDKIECFYEVKYSLLYEPFVIARKGIPPYDERFSGWSEVESHHKLLLHVLGYKYFVLKNVFLVHKGWKYKSDTSQQKIKEHEAHTELWNDFINDISML